MHTHGRRFALCATVRYMSVLSRTRQPSILLRTVSGSLSALLPWRDRTGDPSDLISAPFDAIRELGRRRQDPRLQKKVEEFLQGDIPDYFADGPILYLARHIVTPNFETLRFIHLIRELGLKIVVTEDSKGLFVSQNEIKRALCKLPVCRRVTQKDGGLHEHYHNLTVVDFNKADGKPFCDIETVWGENLIDFHTRLFSELHVRAIETPDDAEWVDRHHRGNLLEHYKQLLSLFVVHGVFFENYNLDDEHEVTFVKEVLRPACRFVEEQFGYPPIIVPIFPTSFESYHFWMSYPPQVLDIVRESMHNRHLHA